MKHIHIWMVLTISFVVSPYVAHKIHAKCAHENHKHIQKNVINCPYSQKDLTRIMNENKDRYYKNCEAKTCFYCGCSVNEHSAE